MSRKNRNEYERVYMNVEDVYKDDYLDKLEDLVKRVEERDTLLTSDAQYEMRSRIGNITRITNIDEQLRQMWQLKASTLNMQARNANELDGDIQEITRSAYYEEMKKVNTPPPDFTRLEKELERIRTKGYWTTTSEGFPYAQPLTFKTPRESSGNPEEWYVGGARSRKTRSRKTRSRKTRRKNKKIE